MKLLRIAVLPLRVVLVLTFALLVVVEVLSFPGAFLHDWRTDPDFSSWRWLLLVVIEVGLVCVQVVVVCTWRLLAMVVRDEVFTRSSVRWVDVMLGSLALGWGMLVTVGAVVLSRADDPGVGVVFALVLLPLTCFVLVLVVMRALLMQATLLRTDLDGVI